MEKADDGAGGGGGNEPKADDKSKDASGDKKSEAEGDNLDEFGYEKDPEAKGDKKPEGKADDKSKQDSSAEPPKIEKPGTGYDKEPEKVEEVQKPEEKPAKIELGFELDLKGLNDDNAKWVQEFAKENELTQAQAQKLAGKRKAEQDEAAAYVEEQKKQAETSRKQIRAAWHKELKEDKTFGGENFVKNVARVEQVLEQHMPLTKKDLTERGAMLPPTVMRDLLGLWESLYGGKSVVQGDPPGAGKDKEQKNEDPLDFYNS